MMLPYNESAVGRRGNRTGGILTTAAVCLAEPLLSASGVDVGQTTARTSSVTEAALELF